MTTLSDRYTAQELGMRNLLANFLCSVAAEVDPGSVIRLQLHDFLKEQGQITKEADIAEG